MRTVPLGELADSVMGQAPPGKACNKEGNGTPFVKAGEFDDRFPVVREWTTQPLKYAKSGDVLICVVGATAGKINQGIDCAIGRSVAAIRPKANRLDTGFLYHLLRQKTLEMREKSQGLAQGVITREMIASVEVPDYKLEEQKRIAAILDQADDIRRKRQHAIERLNQLGQAIFHEMFGDKLRKIDTVTSCIADACDKITDGTHHSPEIQESGVPYVTAKHLRTYGLDFFANPWFISEEDHKGIYSRCNPEKGDILYIKDGATTGIAAINEYDFPFSMLSSLALLKINRSVCLPEYVCAWLNDATVKKYMTDSMSGAGITRLTLAKIKSAKIFIPTISDQQKFSKVSRYLAAQKIVLNHALALENSLFNSLQHRAFTGQL